MSPKRLPLFLSLLLLAACVLYILATCPKLPDRVAVHFDSQGKPNGWDTRSHFVLWFSLFLVGLNALFLIVIPLLMNKVPKSLVNVPWKDYWFSTPERRREIMGRMKALGHWVGVYMNAFFLLIYYLILQENVKEVALRISFSTFLVVTIVCAVAFPVALVTAMFVWMKPPRESP